ncbi:hypothetical protein INR49_016324 [Caranx melampygus]|nr:hypothetical protein INR49_016324 [Caranx melampygus]
MYEFSCVVSCHTSPEGSTPPLTGVHCSSTLALANNVHVKYSCSHGNGRPPRSFSVSPVIVRSSSSSSSSCSSTSTCGLSAVR